MAKISLGYSPCPNDTFIFDAIANQKIDLGGLEFDIVLADVEQLNQMAMRGQLQATKLSYAAFGRLQSDYILLNAGSALGEGCGPLVVSRADFAPAQVNQARIAIPGFMTTANFLFSLKYPQALQKTAFLFSDIEDAVVDNRADLGLIIHENRFTYAQKGLHLVADLGAFWEETTGCPIPLGGIAVRRDLPQDVQQKLDRVMRRSVEAAFAQPDQTMDYVSCHAQAMEPEVMRQHIALYVNDYTRDLGERGRAAVQLLFQKAKALELIDNIENQLFV